MEWISVDDRLPELDTYVLGVSLEFMDVAIVRILCIDSIDNQWWTEDESCVGEVTHWQPLPDPPK